MRRSLAPSQVKKSLTTQNHENHSSINFRKDNFPHCQKSKESHEENDETVIQRLPICNFLSIPDDLKKSFKIPSGCIITKESIELRRTKTLGLRKSWLALRPGSDFKPITSLATVVEDEGDDNIDQDPASTIQKLPPFEPLVLWTDSSNPLVKVEVIPELASKLRPHQREGVQFLFECTMGLRGFEGQGCILADDMGLGKTLMSITLLWTLLNQGFEANVSAIRKAVVVCPTSLVGNWDNEIKRWVGEKCITFPVRSEPKKIIQNFISFRGKGVLIVSYETQRRYAPLFLAASSTGSGSTGSCCELLICDEAHKLKNAESGLSKALDSLPARKRVLLSGTPMQNELTEFYNMVNFCNPNILGSVQQFRKRYERPILLSREPHATDKEIQLANQLQKELSTIVNEFILKRGNILNAQHLPPKLVQFVCCRLSPLQDTLYDYLINSKECQHIRDGKQSNILKYIRYMISICSHPLLLPLALRARRSNGEEDELLSELVSIIDNYETVQRNKSDKKAGGNNKNNEKLGAVAGRSSRMSGSNYSRSSGSNNDDYLDVEESGKFQVLFRLMQILRCNGEKDRIVIVSNFTSTLDLIGQMCSNNQWPFLRLDGSTSGMKRTKLVDEFNSPTSNAFAFLLSSKAGGCGINLIGGNRLVLFDPDWNPASDKQAAARIWREGQKKRCFIYRFMSTGTIEEKIIQRQLSKEGLQNIVDDKEQVNQFSTHELRALFSRRKDTRSDTHDTLRCKRCNSVKVLTVDDSQKHNLGEIQIKHCDEFLVAFIEYLNQLSTANDVLINTEELVELLQNLTAKTFPTLPLFSRQLRNIILNLDREYSSCRIFSEFQRRWNDTIPLLATTGNTLTTTATATGKDKSSDVVTAPTKLGPSIEEEEEEDKDEVLDEYVEQEGCPDEDDFNSWSHHCNVQSCDDSALQQATIDDTIISFIFGLEITWTLLQQKIEATKEINEQKKLLAKRDLEELNMKRKREKESSNIEENKEENNSDDEENIDENNDITNDKEITKKDRKRKKTSDKSIDITTKPTSTKTSKNDKNLSDKAPPSHTLPLTTTITTTTSSTSREISSRMSLRLKNKPKIRILDDDDSDDNNDIFDSPVKIRRISRSAISSSSSNNSSITMNNTSSRNNHSSSNKTGSNSAYEKASNGSDNDEGAEAKGPLEYESIDAIQNDLKLDSDSDEYDNKENNNNNSNSNKKISSSRNIHKNKLKNFTANQENNNTICDDIPSNIITAFQKDILSVFGSDDDEEEEDVTAEENNNNIPTTNNVSNIDANATEDRGHHQSTDEVNIEKAAHKSSEIVNSSITEPITTGTTPPPSTTSTTAATTWECSVCTFLCLVKASKCPMCHTRRTSSIAAAAAASASTIRNSPRVNGRRTTNDSSITSIISTDTAAAAAATSTPIRGKVTAMQTRSRSSSSSASSTSTTRQAGRRQTNEPIASTATTLHDHDFIENYANGEGASTGATNNTARNPNIRKIQKPHSSLATISKQV